MIILKRSFVAIPVLLLALMTLSACSFTKKSDNNWKDEVAQAQECGMDGLPCCLGKETLCQFQQQCCYDPNNPQNTYCSENCDFGKKDQFCRKDEPRCDGDLVCSRSYCKEAGKEGQPCRVNGKICDNDLVCFDSICSKCGENNEPCCGADPRCSGEKKSDANRNDCFSGVCLACGSSGNRSCDSLPHCAAGNLSSNNLCFSCGKINEPCCETDGKNDGCDQASNLKCHLGFCEQQINIK